MTSVKDEITNEREGKRQRLYNELQNRKGKVGQKVLDVNPLDYSVRNTYSRAW